MDTTNIGKTLDELLAKVNLSKVTASGAGFEDLPDAYYLSEVQSAELKLNSNNDPMVSFKTKVVEDGWHYDAETDSYSRVEKSANRMIFKNWILKSEMDVKRFVSDMLKFEDSEGNSILGEDAMAYFTNTEFLVQAINIIAEAKLRIYIQISSYTKDDEKRTSQNFVKWSAVNKIAEDYGIGM